MDDDGAASRPPESTADDDVAEYPDYDYPVPRSVDDLVAIRDGTGRWRRKNRDAMKGMQTRSGAWMDASGLWTHQVRGKVVEILAGYLPEAPQGDVEREIVAMVREQNGGNLVLRGSEADLGQLTELGHVMLRARGNAWRTGDSDGSYYLALYGGRALIHAQEAKTAIDKRVGQSIARGRHGDVFGVSVGEGPHRSWDDFRRYGFVSGGQARWYSQTLHNLSVGDRIYAYIPKVGFVGTGIVTAAAVPVSDFLVVLDGQHVPLLSAPLRQPGMAENADDPQRSEYCVAVAWDETRERDAAFTEPGLRRNQNTAFRLTHEPTLVALAQEFGVVN